MSKTRTPPNYQPCLSLYQTQMAIGLLKRSFEEALVRRLNLMRVSAPLFVDPATGLNDNLNGIERPVSFEIKETGGKGQVVQSLAKWKRMALYRYRFAEGEGLYTDMNAIRRDEEMDNLHSIYVDQWDWEKVLPPGQRNQAYLLQTVREIVAAMCDTMQRLRDAFPVLPESVSPEVYVISTQQLEDLYPELTPQQREERCVREHPTTFLMQIGGPLRSGMRHDGRAPDYDDWNLNGDILVWNDTLGQALELSSMGIRVDAATLDKQLRESGCDDRRELLYHRMLLGGELPLTIGGGIGQSRLSMQLLAKAHIGEVQASIWDEETWQKCRAAGIPLL